MMPTWGQFYFFEGDTFRAAQPPAKPVIADVTSTLTTQTSWGPFTQSETGKYWRSRDGKIRQDTAFGISRVVDLGSFPRKEALIDYELRRISARVDRTDLGPLNLDVTGRDFEVRNHRTTKLKKTGEAVVEGLKVTIRQGTYLGIDEAKPSPLDLSFEIWTSEDLKMILVFKIRSKSAELEQRYHNIRREEPDPSLFEMPPGFHIVTTYPRAVGSMCLRREVGITGERRPSEVDRFACTP